MTMNIIKLIRNKVKGTSDSSKEVDVVLKELLMLTTTEFYVLSKAIQRLGESLNIPDKSKKKSR